ncbi:MAG: M13 family metallopeptidase [Bacteroidota bacterium]
MKTTKLLSILLTLFFIAGTSFSQTPAGGDFLTRAMDKSVNPGADFFKYATGTWMKNNPIPSTESAWGVGNLVQEETYARLRSILEEASATSSEKGTSKQKIGDFYFSGMDSAAIEKQGLAPLEPEFKLINSIKNTKDLCETVALLQKEGVNVMFVLFVDQDAKKSDQYALTMWQGGLGLPNREYYFRQDARIAKVRDEYKKHLVNMFRLLGQDEKSSAADANSVYLIETFLADSSRKLEDLRDPYANYNKMAVEGLNNVAPSIDWNYVFEQAGIKKIDSLIVGQPEFYKQLSEAVKKFSIDQWKAYLRWQLVNSYAEALSSPFDMENFHFKGTVLSGIEEQKPRWKRIQDATEGQLGELLGQIYVQKYYSPATKKRYEKLVADIIDAFAERIKRLDWMSDSTKEKALAKLNAVTRKVGYPDKWKDFSKLSVDRTSYVRNNINANIFWFERNAAKLGQPVDRLEWSMTPQTYNAYYNPSNNEIVLPAAMFIVPGVPDSLLDDAVIYSYAGASTIGHEITHGFDDQGKQFDAKGNLTDWWTKQDEKKFNDRAQLMIDQFDEYVVLDSMHINGKATVGENIADLGGLVIGLDAFRKTDQYKEGKVINGLTPLQRFWLGYAYSWLGHQRPERLARQVMTDVHSPAFLRVNGPLSDIPEFYDAFGVKEGDPMYRPENKRVKIW